MSNRNNKETINYNTQKFYEEKANFGLELEQQSPETTEEIKKKTQNLENKVENIQTTGSFYEYVKQSNAATQITELLHNDGSQESLEERSNGIENIRGEFTLGALNPELQKTLNEHPQILQNIKTGLSLYFTDWLNDLTPTKKKEIENIGNISNIALNGTQQVFNILKNLNSFKQQMVAISSFTEGMEIYATTLSGSEAGEGKPIREEEAFISSENIVRLLKKHTLPSGQKRPGFQSFDGYFKIENEPEINGKNIVNNLNYNQQTHNLMKQVLTLGPKVLQYRSNIKSTFGDFYEMVNEIFTIIPFNKGKSLAETIKGTRREGPINLIASIIGYGSLDHYEKLQKEKLKDKIKDKPNIYSSALSAAINYVEQNPKNDISDKFANFQGYLTGLGLSDTEKEKYLLQLPHIDTLKESIIKNLENTETVFFIDKQYTTSINLMAEEFYTNDTQIKPDKLSDYKQFIITNIDIIIDNTRFNNDGKLSSSEKIKNQIDSGKTKKDIEIYLLTSLSFPTKAEEYRTGESKKEDDNEKKKEITELNNYKEQYEIITKEEGLIAYLIYQQGVGGGPAILQAALKDKDVNEVFTGKDDIQKHMKNNISDDFYDKYSSLTARTFLSYRYEKRHYIKAKLKQESLVNTHLNTYDEYFKTAKNKYFSDNNNISWEDLKTIGYIESTLNPEANKNNPKTKYKGIMQLDINKYSTAIVYNPPNAIDAATKKLYDGYRDSIV